MKKTLLTIVLLALSVSAFAADDTIFSALDCRIESLDRLSRHEQTFRLLLNFKNKVNAINESGLAQNLTADATFQVLDNNGKIQSLRHANLGLGQETNVYGHEIHGGGRLFGSGYNSNLNIQPKVKSTFFKQSLIEYTGSIELNAFINGNDDQVIKTSNATYLKCSPIF